MADLLTREVAGIDAAAEAFAELLGQAASERVAREDQPTAATPPDPPKERRDRRDIRGMVLDELHARDPLTYTEGELAAIMPGVRLAQIGAALAYHEAGGRAHHRNGHWRAGGGDGKDADREPVPADELASEAAG